MWKHWTVIPSPFLHGKLLINVYSSSHFTRCLFFKSVTESVCSPHLPLPPPPPPPNFLNVTMTFNLILCFNNNFQTKKFDFLRGSLDLKLISCNITRDTQKHLFDFQFFLEKNIQSCSMSPHLTFSNCKNSK